MGHVAAADLAKVQDKVAAAAAAAAAEKRIMLRQASSRVKVKPAVMTVRPWHQPYGCTCPADCSAHSKHSSLLGP